MAEEQIDPGNINRWWKWVRPFFHVISFIVIITFIAATKYSNVEGYGETLAVHERRISALEVWQAQESQNSAVTRQEVHDIHERVIGK